ncbi:MAG: response regulator transcription factor [Anaerolineales bacterium]
MTEETLLLIDDDITLLELLSDHLASAGYSVSVAGNGPTGLQLAEEQQTSLIIIDVMMPGMDGWEVCRRLRERSKVPIIMLTAKSEEVNKLHGFRLGVDDYVTKPFSFAELTARIGALLNRSRASGDVKSVISSGDLQIDFDQRRVSIDDQIIEFTPTEYRMLECLARSEGRTVPTESILKFVWGSEYAGEVAHVKHYIWSLRKKIEVDPGDPQHILTERGFGYRFE